MLRYWVIASERRTTEIIATCCLMISRSQQKLQSVLQVSKIDCRYSSIITHSWVRSPAPSLLRLSRLRTVIDQFNKNRLYRMIHYYTNGVTRVMCVTRTQFNKTRDCLSLMNRKTRRCLPLKPKTLNDSKSRPVVLLARLLYIPASWVQCAR